MGTTAARKAKMILQNTQDVLADELLTACQAIDIRRRLNTHGQGLTPLHEAIYQHVRKEVAFYEVDREISPDIRAVEKMIRSGELLDIVKKYMPDFEEFSELTHSPRRCKVFPRLYTFFLIGIRKKQGASL